MRRVRFDQQSKGFEHWICRQLHTLEHFSASKYAHSYRDRHIEFVDSFKDLTIFDDFTTRDGSRLVPARV